MVVEMQKAVRQAEIEFQDSMLRIVSKLVRVQPTANDAQIRIQLVQLLGLTYDHVTVEAALLAARAQQDEDEESRVSLLIQEAYDKQEAEENRKSDRRRRRRLRQATSPTGDTPCGDTAEAAAATALVTAAAPVTAAVGVHIPEMPWRSWHLASSASRKPDPDSRVAGGSASEESWSSASGGTKQKSLQQMEKRQAKRARQREAKELVKTDASELASEDQATEGIQMSFLCRAPTCMFFGMNDNLTWIPEVSLEGVLSDYHFKCPRCGEFFQPGSTSRGQVKAAFCITTTCPLTGAVCHIPAVWPRSLDMRWVNEQIEITARNMKTEEDLDAWHNRTTCDLAKFLREQKVPQCFQRLEFTKAAQYRMSKKWHFEEIQKIGYVMGAHLTDLEAARAPFENWNEMIGIMGNHVAACRSIVSRL